MEQNNNTSKIVALFLATTITVSSGCAYSVLPYPHQHHDYNQNGICDVCGTTYSTAGYGNYSNGSYYYGGRSYGHSGSTTDSPSAANGVSQGAKGGIGSSAHAGASS